MKTPKIPQMAPYIVEVEAGKTYYWCACGLSTKQPFCNGSHKGSSFSPIAFMAESAGRLRLCGCKHSKCGAKCDGSHLKLQAHQG